MKLGEGTSGEAYKAGSTVCKANAMYAEIGKDDLEEKASLLTEGNVYTFSRFMVSLAKRTYRTVQGVYMINFTCHTIVEQIDNAPDGFLDFVCDPIPFSDLPAYLERTSAS